MIRLILTTIIACLISIGAISNNLLASELINHVNTEHSVSSKHAHHHHSHGKHAHHHEHKHKKSTKKPNSTSGQDHTHSFELTFLTLTFSSVATAVVAVDAPSISFEHKIAVYSSNLNINNFSTSVFRPPIV
jgi:ABC-type Zn2+ transport system substrate-binding protein/surface adhesin